MQNNNLPPVFLAWNLPCVHTADGFWMSRKSVADILLDRDIRTFPNDRNQERECALFFDDWYLYGICTSDLWVYSLVKLREQEHDKEQGRIADGDAPGVTVCFISFDTEVLTRCLCDPTFDNRKTLNREINRVVSARGETHHPELKRYFCRTDSQGAYLIAEAYVQKIAGLARDGRIPVPEAYRCAKAGSRLPRFIRENNHAAGHTVCDDAFIYLRDSRKLTQWEKLAILATHTADVSFPSFAAEVQYHACFLTAVARIPIPFLGKSLYDSAIRADMTIDDCELEGPAPFHNVNSRWVRRQAQRHPESIQL